MLPMSLLLGLALGQTSAEAPSPPPEPAADRGLLMKALDRTPAGAWLDERKITIGGWTDMSFTASTANGSMLPMGFNYRANDFLLQQNWLRIERAVDTSADHATYGFHSDWILPGSDYRFTLARGLWDSQTGRYGIDPIQFYGEAYFPNVGKGLDVKVGRFSAPCGAESNAAIDNFLPSRSYSFIYNPFTQTGLLSVLKLDDTWSVKNGLVMGNDVFIDPAASPYYVGGARWAPKDGPSTAEFTTFFGSGRYNQVEQFHNPQLFNLVLTHKLTDKLTWTSDNHYGYTTNVPGIGFADWFGLVNYLTYSFTDKLSGTTRLEFFDDCMGQRTGFSGLYTDVTAGVTYKPIPWLWLRPELRLDHNDNRPFEGDPVLFTAAFDVIVKW